jgi:T-complex protein 1 subunit alpha
LVSNPKNLEKIREKEQEILLDRLALIVKSGANVIFTTLGMDDIASKYLVSKGVMGLRRLDPKDMKRLAKATGATIVKTFANNDGTESFGEELLGRATSVYEENLGDNDYIFVNKP